MNTQRRLTCFCLAFVTLAACAAGGRTNSVVTLDQKDQSLTATPNQNIIFTESFTPKPNQFRKFPNWHDRLNSALLIENDLTRPVNERYPSAVLFGRTCGGTIISPTWVLSAGHCTLFTNGRDILAGTNNTENDTGVRVRVKRLVIHPLFSVGPYWLNAESFNLKQVGARWDFLLAELETPLLLNGITIAAAQLDDNLRHKAGEEVGYAGYGAEHFGETMRSDMHAMELQILADEECAPLEQFNARDMLCSKGRPPKYDSACNGDSGSGLIRNGHLIGVASWVEDDARECRSGARVVFSRVAAVREWIRQVTKI